MKIPNWKIPPPSFCPSSKATHPEHMNTHCLIHAEFRWVMCIARCCPIQLPQVSFTCKQTLHIIKTDVNNEHGYEAISIILRTVKGSTLFLCVFFSVLHELRTIIVLRTLFLGIFFSSYFSCKRCMWTVNGPDISVVRFWAVVVSFY